MSDVVIVAIIGLLGSGIGSFVGIVTNTKLTNYKIEELKEKVNKHNNVIERTYKLEEKDSIKTEQIKVINHRIDDLEKEK